MGCAVTLEDRLGVVIPSVGIVRADADGLQAGNSGHGITKKADEGQKQEPQNGVHGGFGHNSPLLGCDGRIISKWLWAV